MKCLAVPLLFLSESVIKPSNNNLWVQSFGKHSDKTLCGKVANRTCKLNLINQLNALPAHKSGAGFIAAKPKNFFAEKLLRMILKRKHSRNKSGLPRYQNGCVNYLLVTDMHSVKHAESNHRTRFGCVRILCARRVNFVLVLHQTLISPSRTIR